MPTRIVVGAGDPAIPAVLLERRRSDDADDVAVEIVPECGHFVPEERPELVARARREPSSGCIDQDLVNV